MRWRCSSPETSWSTARAASRCFAITWCPARATCDGGGNTLNIRLEYAIVVTFLYGQHYECNEYCKYYKNVENPSTSSFRRSTVRTTTATSAT